MIFDAKSGIRGKVVDLDTGKVVRKVIRLNTDTGYIKAYKVDAAGEIETDAAGNNLWYEAHGRFHFEPSVPPTAKAIVMGAAKCELCLSPLTLPGDDLCARCRAKERGQRNKMDCQMLSDDEIGHKCQRCSADAVWAVSDEVQATPSVTGFRVERRGRKQRRVIVPHGLGSQQWQRAATVGRRYYCSKHYRPPQLLDSRGEVIKSLETNTRPN